MTILYKKIGGVFIPTQYTLEEMEAKEGAGSLTIDHKTVDEIAGKIRAFLQWQDAATIQELAHHCGCRTRLVGVITGLYMQDIAEDDDGFLFLI